jgi:hypothetical protein
MKRFLSAHACLIAQSTQGIYRELRIPALYFLKTQDVGPVALYPGYDDMLS